MALDKLTKIDGGGISTTSDYRVGIITASKFIGPFDGTGGNFSGVVTATNGVFSGNISAVDGNFSGNVSIAGTLTYEDVTNIDSVGIITAQKDIHVGAGVSVVGVGTFGSLDISGDIDVDGHTNLDNVSVAGITTVNGGFIFDNGTNAGKDLQWQPTNNRLAFFNDVKATFGNTVDLQIYHSPNENHIYGSTSKPIIFSTNTDERFRINSDGQVSLGDNPTVASDAALHIELTGAREYLRLNADAGNNNAYIEIQADDNRRKALIFKSGGTRRGVIGVGDSDEAANATSLFFSASANAGGNSPHMVITSTGLIGFNNNAPEGKGIDVTHSRTNAYAATSDHRNLAQIIARNGSDAAGRFASISLVSGGSTQAEGSINLVQTGSYTGDLTVKMRSAVSTWAESLRITSGGNVGIGSATPGGVLDLYHATSNTILNVKSGDAGAVINITDNATRSSIEQNGASLKIVSDTAGTYANSDIRLQVDGATKVLIDDDGDVGINQNTPTAKLHIVEATSTTAVKIKSGTNTNQNTHITMFNDNDVPLHLGVYGSSANTSGTIASNTAFMSSNSVGGLAINAYHASGVIRFGTGSSQTERVRITAAGQVQINTDGGSGALTLGASQDFKMYHDAGGPTIFTDVGNQGFKLQIKELNLTEYTGTATRLKIDTSGHVTPGASGTQNLGSTSLEWGDLFIADNKKVFLGSDQDFTLHHNNAHAIIKNTTGRLYVLSDDLWFKNQADNSNLARFLNGDTSIFYFAGNEKLRTSPTGATVIGEVAASQDYPTIRPTLDFNFTAQKKLDPRIAYTRTGPASFVNEFGKVIKVGDNVPRFDHDPITRECKGYLVEESRTNVAEVSEDFGNTSFWYSANQTVTTNVATAPDGTLTADNVVPAAGSAVTRYLYFSASEYPMSASVSYTTSIFVKKNGLRYFALQAHDNGSGSGHRAGFDLDNGTVVSGTPNNMGSASAVSASIVEFPNGWFRCIITGTTAGSGSTGRTAFSFSSALNSQASVGAITADGTNGGYVWGHQVEAGAFATSYIPTDGAEVTRGVDITTIDGNEFTEFYNDDEWTMVTDTNVDNSQSLVASPATVNSINFEGDNNTKKFQTRYVTSSTINQGYVDVVGAMSGSALYDLTGGGVGNYNMKTAHAAKVNDVAVSHNGGTVQTDTSVTMLTGGSIMNIGENPKQYHIKRIMYYPKRLPNTQLVTLTS